MKECNPKPSCAVLVGGCPVRGARHAVILPDQATEQEEHAGRELIAHLRRLTGERLPLRREARIGNRHPIFVGRTAALARIEPEALWEQLGDEGTLMRGAGGALYLAGGRRGALYACYSFLEEMLGVHWLTRDCTLFPRGKTFALRSFRRVYRPPLEYREPFAFCGFDPDWSVRNKSNGFASRLDARRGGGTVYEGFVHTFYKLVPPERYFKTHPEYFSLLDGQRCHERSQLCLTNRAVLELVIDEVRQRLRRKPEAAIVSISQNDGSGGACQCARCRAVDAAEGSPAGALLRFVNAVAERLEPEFPGVAFDTLAYTYTRRPPRLTRPRPSVIVRLCSIECSFAQPFAAGPQNRAFKADVIGWSRICRRLYVWDYVTNFAHYIQPHPNLRVLQPNIRFLVRHGVKGIFEQGGFQSPGGEFQELRTWLLAQLLWNPNANFHGLLRTFLTGYYGPAAPLIGRYLALMHDAVEKAGTYLGCYSTPTASFLTAGVRAKADRLFDEAEAAARAAPVLRQRVQQARLPLQYLNLVRRPVNFRETKGALRPGSDDGNFQRHLARFERVARAAGVTHLSEGRPNLDAQLAAWRPQAVSLAIARLENKHLKLAVLPALGGRIWSLRDTATKREWLAPVPRAGLAPDDGGYEEYSEAAYRSPGWSEPFQVRARAAGSLLLEADLRNGLRLTRRIELDPGRPLVRIVSTLRNRKRQALPACLRIHPAWAVDNWATISLRLLTASGAWRRQNLPLAKVAVRVGNQARHFEGSALPSGAWALADKTSGALLVNRFHPAQVKVCHLDWGERPSPRVHLELWSPSVTLPPGAELAIAHEYEIMAPPAGRERK